MPIPAALCDQPVNSSEIDFPCNSAARVAEETAAKETGKMRPSTVVLMVVSTIYFFLLVLGFCLVARRKARTPITPAGNPPLRANVTVTRPPWLPQWLSDIHKLWARWLSNNSQPSSSPPHPPSTRRQKSPLSGATSSFEMSRISNASIQAGQPGDGNTMSGQRGHVEAVADTPDPGSGDTLSTCK